MLLRRGTSRLFFSVGSSVGRFAANLGDLQRAIVRGKVYSRMPIVGCATLPSRVYIQNDVRVRSFQEAQCPVRRQCVAEALARSTIIRSLPSAAVGCSLAMVVRNAYTHNPGFIQEQRAS